MGRSLHEDVITRLCLLVRIERVAAAVREVDLSCVPGAFCIAASTQLAELPHLEALLMPAIGWNDSNQRKRFNSLFSSRVQIK